MSIYAEHISELCMSNSIQYHIDGNRVLIDDEFWFYISNGSELYSFRAYIDIISGRNEMINQICDKLNTTPKQGCNIKLFEFHQNEMVCISDNSFIIDINNMADTVGYTKYERFINFKLKIMLNNPLEYHLINDNQTQKNLKTYKLKSTVDLKNVLDQLCTFEKGKFLCDKDLCTNRVNIQKEFPNPYGWCVDKSEFMLSTARGYRDKYSSFPKYYFCSKECMDLFDKYKRCHRCHEDGEGTYIEELGYTLCNSRGDWNPSCISKYRLEQRFKADYANYGFYEMDDELQRGLLHDNTELKQIIAENGNKITYHMLMDLITLKRSFEVRERPGVDAGDKASFKELCDSIKEEL